jgi:hypothetical protein
MTHLSEKWEETGEVDDLAHILVLEAVVVHLTLRSS